MIFNHLLTCVASTHVKTIWNLEILLVFITECTICVKYVYTFFQMDMLLLLLISGLIQFASSQRPDNDGNDIDNDQVANINAFGNVITPIKGNKLIKKNNNNKIFHIYLNHDDEDDMLIVNDSMPETMNNLIGLAGLGSNMRCHHRSNVMRKSL